MIDNLPLERDTIDLDNGVERSKPRDADFDDHVTDSTMFWYASCVEENQSNAYLIPKDSSAVGHSRDRRDLSPSETTSGFAKRGFSQAEGEEGAGARRKEHPKKMNRVFSCGSPSQTGHERTE